MLGCTGVGVAVVSTWDEKFQDNSGSREKAGTLHIFIHHWLILYNFVDLSVAKI